MTKFKLVCFHPGEGDEEEKLIEMVLDSAFMAEDPQVEQPENIPLLEVVFVCPECKKNTLLHFERPSITSSTPKEDTQ